MDTTFPHNYEIEELTEYPNTSLPRYYPGGSQGSGHDGLILRVRPASGAAWWGTFGLVGKGFVSGVFTTPDPNRFCIVASGDGFLVSAEDPTWWEEVRAIPVRGVWPVKAHGLLVFADFTELCAYGENGLKWRTKRLVLDGLKITEITEHAIRGEGDGIPPSETVEFCVDLLTGEHQGGLPPSWDQGTRTTGFQRKVLAWIKKHGKRS